ncbi:MAG: serine protein kinase PrkA [Proteobacteria bacterium]|nr:serine protein kinase PrkA [Pseudomonadota bacterium]
METITSAIQNLDIKISGQEKIEFVPFENFLKVLMDNPHQAFRNIFQVFYDMFSEYIESGADEYPDDPESINYINYNCKRLFVEGSDNPFFADRIFANRLVNRIEALRRGAQQNKIYIFEGPPGCGKSTFLNNLLMRFEEYCNSEKGMRYEAVWRLDRKVLGDFANDVSFVKTLAHVFGHSSDVYHPKFNDIKAERKESNAEDEFSPLFTEEYIEIPCPSHDHPILMIPKNMRREFFDDLFLNDEFKWKLFTEKEYQWVFKDTPCTICSSLYQALGTALKSPKKVFQMLYARPYRFNRRLGEGISVFNPGDKPLRQSILTNPMLQKRINELLKNSNIVKYIFSQYAKTNNGIYALMDVKSNNVERLIDLHNIISEGLHKVEDVEENVNSIFLALMNPEDKKNIQDVKSFSDRIEYIKIPYVLDLNTEVEIYRNIFGKHIDGNFLPRVLHNFARVVISTRLQKKSEAFLEWIGDPDKYNLYCDKNLQLLKMEIYTGFIPNWLNEEDRKKFTAPMRRKAIGEAEFDGVQGLSGRDSIKIFNQFYSTYAKENKLITMSMLKQFFTKIRKDLCELIPEGFFDSLMKNYNYTILQEVKESLYYYNEDQISKDVKNYMFAVNFEPGTTEVCTYTKEKLEITESYFDHIEQLLYGSKNTKAKLLSFRKATQREYTTSTLPQDILLNSMKIEDSKLFKTLHEKYVYSLKEKVLDPFLDNENFRKAIKDYGTEAFKTYDQKIKDDVTYLMKNLCESHRYSTQGAKEICIYMIDSELARTF